jgi:hypothetical protein
MRSDAGPQAWKNRGHIRWNTLRIFSDRVRRRWSQIFRRSRMVNVGQAPCIGCYCSHEAIPPPENVQKPTGLLSLSDWSDLSRSSEKPMMPEGTVDFSYVDGFFGKAWSD